MIQVKFHSVVTNHANVSKGNRISDLCLFFGVPLPPPPFGAEREAKTSKWVTHTQAHTHTHIHTRTHTHVFAHTFCAWREGG